MDSPVTKPWHTTSFCNIAGALRWQAERQPGTTAVQCPGNLNPGPKKAASFTFREFNDLADACARGLNALGMNPGERAVLVSEPSVAFTLMFNALARLGAIPVVIPAGMSPENIQKCMGDIAPRAFIGAPGANVRRKLKGWGNPSCDIAISTGLAVPGVATGIKALYKQGLSEPREVFHNATPGELAAITFSAGTGGTPRAVSHSHGELAAQASVIQEAFDIGPAETSLTTIPLLSVFDAPMGVASVYVDVDNANPGPADAKRLVQAAETHRVSNIFLSAAMLEALSHYAKAENINLPLIRRLVTFGASPRLETIARLEDTLHDLARIHVSYGSAECFPVSTITNHDVDSVLEEMMESGEGVCVGRPVGAAEVKIIAPSDKPYDSLNTTPVLPPGIIGEIIVSAPHCAGGYSGQDVALNKIPGENGKVWHRMGDIGSIDGRGRLWYCGRISQRIDTGQESLYPDQAEALFNQHPDARHTALVGVGPAGKQMPVLCVELRHKLREADNERVHFDLLQLAQSCGLTRSVRTVLFHPGFPTDPENSAAIPRAQLAEWAASKVKV